MPHPHPHAEHALEKMSLKEETYQLKMKLNDIQTGMNEIPTTTSSSSSLSTPSSNAPSRKSLMQRLTGQQTPDKQISPPTTSRQGKTHHSV